jgi:hypothetical protein
MGFTISIKISNFPPQATISAAPSFKHK